MITIKNKIVFSNDIKKILNGNNALNFKYFKNGIPENLTDTIDNLRINFSKETKKIFNNKAEIITEEKMQDSLLTNITQYINKIPIVTLDSIYLKPNNQNIYFLDCTRLNQESNLVSRNDMNNPFSVEQQIKKLSLLFKLQKQQEIIITDDVIYSGSVIKKVIKLFNKEGIKVKIVISAITTSKAQKDIIKSLNIPIKSEIILDENIIDQICERDFYFGIAGSGIATRTNENIIKKAPYFYPYGNPIVRASIPEKNALQFSKNCINRSILLWEEIQKRTNQFIYIKDLPEQIINTNPNEEIIYTLKKGLK